MLLDGLDDKGIHCIDKRRIRNRIIRMDKITVINIDSIELLIPYTNRIRMVTTIIEKSILVMYLQPLWRRVRQQQNLRGNMHLKILLLFKYCHYC